MTATMLYKVLLGLLILDSIVLMVAILLQAGQGGGMAAAFGGVSSSASTIFGTRQAGNLLTKTSWWGGALFLALSLTLSLMSASSREPRSVLDQAFPAGGAATQPAPLPTTEVPLPGGATNAPDSSRP